MVFLDLFRGAVQGVSALIPNRHPDLGNQLEDAIEVVEHPSRAANGQNTREAGNTSRSESLRSQQHRSGSPRSQQQGRSGSPTTPSHALGISSNLGTVRPQGDLVVNSDTCRFGRRRRMFLIV